MFHTSTRGRLLARGKDRDHVDAYLEAWVAALSQTTRATSSVLTIVTFRDHNWS